MRGAHVKATVASALAACLCVASAWVLAPASAAQEQPAGPAVEEPPEPRFVVTGFDVTGENPLTEAQVAEILQPFLGEHQGITGLLSAKDALAAAISDLGFAFRRVLIPPQTLEAGRVTFEVVAFKVGKIIVEGNEHFSEANVLRALPSVIPGTVPDNKRLSHERYVANRHPSRQVQVRFRESQSEQALDARVIVEDSDPQTIFATFNNTGSVDTGKTRITFGYQHSNLFDRDHAATVSYTTSPTDPGKVKQWLFAYSVPFYEFGGLASAYALSSDVNSGFVETGVAGSGEGLNISGAGGFWGVSYTHFIRRRGRLEQSVTVGVDDKLFKTTIVGGATVPDVRSRPVSLSYQGTYEFDRATASFFASYARNLWSGRNNDGAFYGGSGAAPGVRVGSDPNWDVVRYGGSLDYALSGDWLLRSRFDAQWTDEPLISGEQFGAGGAKSVRGYAEREATGETGVVANVEVWTPPIALVPGLRFLGFFDAAHVRIKQPGALTQKSQALASLGVGVRWTPDEYVNFEIDAARTLNEVRSRVLDPKATREGDYRVHFNMFLRY